MINWEDVIIGEVIRIDFKNLWGDYRDSIKEIGHNRNVFITTFPLILSLISYDKYPVKNKRIAITNILRFLTYVDVRLDAENKKQKKEDLRNILQIPKETLAFYFSNKLYFKYVKVLSDLKVMSNISYGEKDDPNKFYYKFNQKEENKGVGICKQYKIMDNYTDDKDVCIFITKEDSKEIPFNNQLPEIDKRFIKTIKKVDIDIEGALGAEFEYCSKNTDQKNFKIRVSRIFYTRHKRFLRKGKNVDRIYHSFTNLSKVSRPHLTIKFYDLDIVNCQPLLLVSYFKKNGFMYDGNYKVHVEDGEFYEQFIDENTDRQQVKDKMWPSIYFGFDKSCKINKKFKELYPIIWDKLNEINKNKKEEGTLSSKLQNMEASLFNSLSPISSKHYFTLFDSIYFDNPKDKIYLINDIERFFKQLELKVSIKQENKK